MKTETQITEKNIILHKKAWDELTKSQLNEKATEHKASCQRFLEFLKELESHKVSEHRKYQSVCEFCIKITDLKQAIKLYEEAGI